MLLIFLQRCSWKWILAKPREPASCSRPVWKNLCSPVPLHALRVLMRGWRNFIKNIPQMTSRIFAYWKNWKLRWKQLRLPGLRVIRSCWNSFAARNTAGTRQILATVWSFLRNVLRPWSILPKDFVWILAWTQMRFKRFPVGWVMLNSSISLKTSVVLNHRFVFWSHLTLLQKVWTCII